MEELKELLGEIAQELHVSNCRLDQICEDLSDLCDQLKADLAELGEKLDLIKGAGYGDINGIYEKVSEQTGLPRENDGIGYQDLYGVVDKLDDIHICLTDQTELLKMIKGDSYHSLDDVCERLDEIAERSPF